MEVEYLPYRLHDFSADHRRAARVFLKPATTSQKFLADVNATLAQRTHPLTDSLDGAALVTEDLLIDSHGRVVPSPLTHEVQLRTFVKWSRAASTGRTGCSSGCSFGKRGNCRASRGGIGTDGRPSAAIG
jgi:hypothetical protein